MKNRFLFIISLLLLLSSYSCSEDSKNLLRVGTNLWPGYECLHLAQDLGYYKDSPIKILEFPSASEVMRAYRNKSIDAATLTMDEVFLLKQAGENPKVVLIMDFSHGADVIVGKPQLKNLTELRGQRIGVENTALGAFILSRALGQAGMMQKDVIIVPLEVDKHEKAFKERQVDAVVTFEPTRSRLLKAGGKILFDSTQIPGEIMDVLVVRDSIMESSADVIQDLIKGRFKALNYLEKQPDDAVRRMALREKLSAEMFVNMLTGLHIVEKEENLTLLKEEKNTLIDRMDHLIHIMVKNKLLKQPFNPKSLLDGRFILTAKTS